MSKTMRCTIQRCLMSLLLCASSHAMFANTHIPEVPIVPRKEGSIPVLSPLRTSMTHQKQLPFRRSIIPNKNKNLNTQLRSVSTSKSASTSTSSTEKNQRKHPKHHHKHKHNKGKMETVQVTFSHLHLYADHIEDISVYKDLEESLNVFAATIEEDESEASNPLDVVKYRNIWNNSGVKAKENKGNIDKGEDAIETEFIPQKRDIVKQLLAGLGFRITGQYTCPHTHTRNVLLTTKDPNGVQFVVSAANPNEASITSDDTSATSSSTVSTTGNQEPPKYQHFDEANIKQFYSQHAERQGIAVLAFQVASGDIEALHKKYKEMHPGLLSEDCVDGPIVYHQDGEAAKVLEVYSYYKNEKGGEVDRGTKLRFVQKDPNASSTSTEQPLPGFIPVRATFDKTCMAAYCDHWVSNVVSRTGFLETLSETLGFTPKVDFNAGVVAAGEAQIESTVTGNDSTFVTDDKEIALVDQSQVYLPINNALSEVGHVHGFLEEIGQGIQHVASRVDDLPKFVQRGNDFREITGEGLTFLKIPRSYYGVLQVKDVMMDCPKVSEVCAGGVVECCEKSSFVSMDGAVDLDLDREELQDYLDKSLSEGDCDFFSEYEANREAILDSILKSRYVNLSRLLGKSLTTERYLTIVRNQILVDVQGNDLLFQIFTSNILQRKVGEESPFLEFIQRVCAQCPDSGHPIAMKAGCGGFGIRNFLTLFLSIEVSKAMLDMKRASQASNEDSFNFAQRKVEIFTEQLNEANPILTEISDAMTEEGIALDEMQQAINEGDEVAEANCKERMEKAAAAKTASNEKLMVCSSKYNELMKSTRLAYASN